MQEMVGICFEVTYSNNNSNQCCLPLFALAVCTFAPPQIFFGVSRVTVVLNGGYRYADAVLLLSSERNSERP